MASRLRDNFRFASSSWTRTLPLFTTLGSAETSTAVNFESLNDFLIHARLSGFSPSRVSCPGFLQQLESSRDVDTIVCSALDSDPALRLNAAVAAHWPHLVATGIAMLRKLLGATAQIICIEENSPDVWQSPILQAADEQNIRVVPMHNDYPLSDPTLLLLTLLSRRLRPGQLPTTQNVLMLDANAAMSIASLSRAPGVPIACGILDHRTNRTAYFLSTAATPLSKLLSAGGFPADSCVLRTGDLLRNLPVNSQAIVGNGELTFHITAPQEEESPDACIRSGWCVQVCPTQCHPAYLLDAAQRGDDQLAASAGLASCIECGICSYICPSRLPLLDAIRVLKRRDKQ